MPRKAKTTEKRLKNTTAMTPAQQHDPVRPPRSSIRESLDALTDQIAKTTLSEHGSEEDGESSENPLAIKSQVQFNNLLIVGIDEVYEKLAAAQNESHTQFKELKELLKERSRSRSHRGRSTFSE